jgi:membrane-bound serine protease (ClpP class)
LLITGLWASGQDPDAPSEPVPSSPGRARVIELRIEDVILPLMAEFVGGGFDKAENENADLILITVDTPGGLDSSMRDIIGRILNSPVPVVVYVTPSGSRAASAGFYILLSADVAAMAPGTSTGAASPIFVFGGQPVKIDETLRKKVVNDAAAYLRSIAEKRGRNADLAVKAVTEATAFTEAEALDGKLIDIVADSTEDLLTKLDGREIERFNGTKVTLALAGAIRTTVEMNRRQRFLASIARPDVLFILFVIGVLGLYMEFSNPGLIVPGVVGGISLILALVAIQILPINALGVLLIIGGLVLFALEAKFTSYGLLSLGGVVSMILGAMILIRSPITGLGVSLGVTLGVTVPAALLTVFLMRLVLRTFKLKMATGREQLVGSMGEVTETVGIREAAYEGGKGMVFVQGELWRAVGKQEIPKGASIRVVKVEGLTVHVEPADSGEPSP